MINRDALISQGCVMHWTGEKATANSPKAITSVGDVKQILPFPGAGIGMFDGNGDYVQLEDNASLEFGSNNFTIEFLFNTLTWGAADQFGNHGCVIARNQGVWADPGTWAILLDVGGKFFTFCRDCTSDPVNNCSNVGYNDGNWHHLAWVRSGTSWMLFLDGQLKHTATYNVTVTDSANPILIGKDSVFGRDYNGKLSELRISIGVARYTTNFVPPFKQLDNDSNTKLLLHFNRNDSTFVDSSPSAHTITAYENATQLTSPCGSGILYGPNYTDYIRIPTSSDLTFTNDSDFTIEFWVNGRNRVNDSGYSIIGNIQYSDQGGWGVSEWSTSDYVRYWGYWDDTNGWVLNGTAYYIANQWVHWAIVRKLVGTDKIFRLFRNGIKVMEVIGNGTIGNKGYPFSIGQDPGTPRSTIYLGTTKISEIRISNIARYTSDFTPQSTPFKPDPYTKLLLHMDGVGDAFYDSSDPPGDNGFPILPDGVTVTPNGTFTSVKGKDGRNYLKFDGSTNYVSIQDCDAWYFGDNKFTICCWYKSSTTSVAAQIVGQLATNVTGTWSVRHGCNDTNQFGFYYNAAGTEYMIQSAIAMNDSTWRFLTVIRDGTSLELYINNVLIITGTLVAGAFANNASALEIGRNDVNEAFCEGNIKDLMIFKGTALSLDQLGQIYDETFIY